MYQKTTLPNGLRIVTSTMPHTRSVTIIFLVATGSRYEMDREAGISHFIEHLLFKGTEKRPTSREVSEAIEGIGGVINAGTDKELTIYWCKVATSQCTTAMDVLADIYFNSRFDPVEIDRERQVIMDEIKMTRDIPQHRVNLLIDELLWGGHPLGRDVAGSKETVTGIDRTKMLEYMKNTYLPDKTVIAVAGNIEHDRVISMVGNAMGKWQPTTTNGHTFPPWQELKPVRIGVETKEIEQTNLCLAVPGVSLSDPRRFTFDLLNVILGEGMSSRLFLEVRDKKGLTYNISSYVEHYLDAGSLVISTSVELSNQQAVIEAILEELSKLKETVPEDELSRSKEQAKGHLLLRMEDTRAVAGWLGGQETLSNRIMTIDDVISRIDSITSADIKKLANELFTSDKLYLASVGPSKSRESLESLLKF